MKILAMETSAESCSAALWLDGTVLSRFQWAPKQQTQLLLPMIDALIQESGLVLSQIDGIAYSAGPGAFSGVRIGAAAAHGLALGLDRPVVAVSSLEVLAYGVWRVQQQPRIMVINDARMQEIYTAAFSMVHEQWIRVTEDQLMRPETLAASDAEPWFLVGNGLTYRHMLRIEDCGMDAVVQPQAEDVALLAQLLFGQGLVNHPESALPVYLRNSVWKKLPGR